MIKDFLKNDFICKDAESSTLKAIKEEKVSLDRENMKIVKETKVKLPVAA